MFFRMMKGTFVRQWKKMLMIAITIALGASIATAMLNVMLDVGDKINEELKTYGANITVESQTASVLGNLYELDDEEVNEKMYLKEDTLGELLTIFWANNIRDFAPFTDLNGTVNGNNVHVVGSWFNHHLEYLKKGTVYERYTGLINLRSWWTIKSGAWMDEQKETDDKVAMVGQALAARLGISVGDEILVEGKGNNQETLKVVGIYESGDEEDDYLYTTFSVAQVLSNTIGLVKTISVSAIPQIII